MSWILRYITIKGLSPKIGLNPHKKLLDYIAILEFTQNEGYPPHRPV